MNILQINATDIKGGAAKVAYRLKKELEQRGHETSMLVMKKYSDDPDVYELKTFNPWRQRILKKLSYILANDMDLFSSDHILKSEVFKKADIVHCHNLHSYYFNLGTLHKISKLKPIIWTFHDMWPITAHCAHSFDGQLKDSRFFTCPSLDIYPPIAWHNEKYLERKKTKIYNNSNFHIVTPSKWLADKVNQSVLKDKPLTVIYNGINTEVFKPYDKKTIRQELNLPADKKIVLIVSKRIQSNPWKGGNYLQDILKEFNNRNDVFFIDLGGDTNQNQEKIRTISFIKDENMLAKYYSAADVLLYPSIADNCPLVVLEALACALPVVAFNTGGIPELVSHKTSGYVAEYKNTRDLAEGINFVLGSSLKFSFNEKYKVEKMTDQYLELYKTLL